MALARRTRPLVGAELPSTAPQLILFECSASGPTTAVKRKQTEAFVFPSHPPATSNVRSRLAAAALAVVAVVPLAVLVAVTPATWAAASRPGAGADALLAGLAAVGGWLIAARLVVTAAAVGLAQLPGALGRTARAVATTWTPALARGLVRAALGAAVASGPVLAHGTAMADEPAYPTLDRVITAPAALVPQAAGPAVAPHRAGGAPGSGHVVLVRPGDSLWAIAAAHLPAQHTDEQVARAWPTWYAANRAAIGPDPGQIRPGTRLVWPPAAG
jgi:hypothetical protein